MPSPAVRHLANVNTVDSSGFLSPTASITIGSGVLSIGDLLILTISVDSGDAANWGGITGTGWTRFLNVDAGVGKPKVRGWWKFADSTAAQTYSATWTDSVSYAQVLHWQAWQAGTIHPTFPVGGAVGATNYGGKASPYPTVASTLYSTPGFTGDRVQQAVWSLYNGGTPATPGWGTRPTGWSQTANRESGNGTTTGYNSQYGAYRFLTPTTSNTAVAAQDFTVTTNGTTVRPYAHAVYYINPTAPDPRGGTGLAALGLKTAGGGSKAAQSTALARIGLAGMAPGGKTATGQGISAALGLATFGIGGGKGSSGPGVSAIGLASSGRTPPPIPVFDGRPLSEDPLPMVHARYLIQNILTGEWLHTDLPMTDDKVTLTLSGPCVIEGKIAPEIADLEVTTTTMVTVPHVTSVSTPVYTTEIVPGTPATPGTAGNNGTPGTPGSPAVYHPAVPPVTTTGTKDPVKILQQYGMQNADIIVQAANLVGMPVANAATMVQKETNGQHIWGHDPVSTGGTYTKGGPVTVANYKAMRAAYHKGLAGMQGTGITQLTYFSFLDEAERLHPDGGADRLTNCRVGFKALYNLQKTYGTRDGARRYNGSGSAAEAYASDYMTKLSTWQTRLQGTATVTTPGIPAYWSPEVPAKPAVPGTPPGPASPAIPDTTRTVVTYETHNVVTYTTEEITTTAPLLRSWGHVIYLEMDGEIRAAGIVTEDSYDDQTRTLSCQGISAYPKQVPYGDVYSKFNVDPLTVIQDMWAYVQSFPNGNIGVTVQRLGDSGVRLGISPKQAPSQPHGYLSDGSAPDPAKVQVRHGRVSEAVWDRLLALGYLGRAGDSVEALYVDQAVLDKAIADVNGNKVWTTQDTEIDPYTVNWWDVKTCGSVIDDAIKAVPADFVEQYAWNIDQHTFVDQSVLVAYPRVGRQRDDLRFVTGENIMAPPSLEYDAEGYANAIVGIGAGEGSQALRETAEIVVPGVLRKPYIYRNSKITDRGELKRIVSQQLTLRSGFNGQEITHIVVAASHDNARFGAYNVGDDIYVQVEVPHLGWVRQWCRIVSMTLALPADLVELTLHRSDSFFYGREVQTS